MTTARATNESAPLHGREPHGTLPSRDRSLCRAHSNHWSDGWNHEGP